MVLADIICKSPMGLDYRISAKDCPIITIIPLIIFICLVIQSFHLFQDIYQLVYNNNSNCFFFIFAICPTVFLNKSLY